MKTTKQHFELFKKECDVWLEKLSLDDFEVNYYHEQPDFKCSDCSIDIDYKYRRVDIKFSKDISKDDLNTDYIKGAAKHEILHLLVGEMIDLAQDRYVMRDEIIKADERLIRKLEKIL